MAKAVELDRRSCFVALGASLVAGGLSGGGVNSALGGQLYGLTSSQLADRLDREWPRGLRSRNRNGGSCVFAATETQARFLGLDHIAEFIRRNYRGGEYASRMHRKLDAMGLRYAATVQSDVSFLDWCLGNQRGASRGCSLCLKGPHFVNLVHLDPPDQYHGQATIIDNNFPHRLETWSRSRLIRDWKRSGGWAFTILDGSPPPPTTRV